MRAPCAQSQVSLFFFFNKAVMITDVLLPHVSPRFLNDEHYRKGHIRIINPLPGREIIGLHIPEMKQIARQLAGSAQVDYLLNNFEQAYKENPYSLVHEEIMVWGFVINAMKCSEECRWSRVQAFIPAIDNWAVCDSFCSNAKWAKRMSSIELWERLKPYYSSQREFEVRFALVMSMSYLLIDEGWLQNVFIAIEGFAMEEIHSDYTWLSQPYYVKMAIAWLMATALDKYPQATRCFATNSCLPEDVKRLYARKVRESLRTRSVPPYL
jgi:3-methyladenine DNA glycosylase AlkD